MSYHTKFTLIVTCDYCKGYSEFSSFVSREDAFRMARKDGWRPKSKV